MTVLTFPSNPIEGQVYNALNGIRYVYDGVKWVVETTTSTSEAVTNSTQDRVAPMFVDGDNTGISFTYNAATNTMSAAVTAVNGNRLINGNNEAVLGTDGTLTVPGTVTNDDRLTLNSLGVESGYVAAVLADGDTGKVMLRTDDGTTTKTWEFDKSGNFKLPAGGDIVDSTGNSVLGGGTTLDQNIWVQTFVSDQPQTDLPALASSVEYDADGNIIALFTHFVDPTGSSYTSVGKYTPTGTRIWTVRLSQEFTTDGWGLAVGDGMVYVTSVINTDPPTYSKPVIFKLNATDGSLSWAKSYDFGVDSYTGVIDVASDGNPVVVGYAHDRSGVYNDYITTSKIDQADGSIIWTRKLNGQSDEDAYGMAVGPNGEVVVVGYISQLGLGSDNAVATVVTVPSSNPNWTTQYGGGTEPVYGLVTNNNVVFDITMTGGVPTINISVDTVGGRTVGETITTLYGEFFGGVTGVDDMVINVASVAATGAQGDRMVVVKYDSAGAIQWQKAVLFDAGFNCLGADADIDSSGNVYVTGEYTRDLNPGTTSAMSIVKFNSSGVKQWSRRVVGDCETFGNSIVVGPDDKLYLSGVTQTADQSDYSCVLAKYGFDGTVEWQRLLNNTTTWTFSGGIFFGNGGGSNLAVKTGYVSLSGTFGDPGQAPHAVVVQVATTGDTFNVGDWDFTTATFSGTLNSSASDITVVDAQLTDSDNVLNIDVATITPNFESSAFLIGTIYSANADNHELVNGNYSFRLEADGTISLPTLTTKNSNGNTLTTETLALGKRTNNVVITQQEYNSVNTGSYNIEIRGQRGYGTWNTTGNGGYGSGIEIHGGQGGETSDDMSTGGVGGEGGYVTIRGGNGQAGKGGGFLELRAGDATWSDASNTGHASPTNVNGGTVTLAAGNANSGVAAGNGYGGNVNIQAGTGSKDGQHGNVVINTNNGYWRFGQDGSLWINGGYALSGAQNTTINIGSAPTVAYTSLDGAIGGIKATIKVYVRQADNIDGDHDEDTQMCEMIISTKRRFIDNGGLWIKTAVASVYGVTHTSTLPLATFTVNYVENYVESLGAQPRDVVQILAEPTAAMTGTDMWVMVTATELTND